MGKQPALRAESFARPNHSEYIFLISCSGPERSVLSLTSSVGSGPAHGEVGGEPENPMNGNRRITEGKTCSLFLGVVSLPCRPSHWKLLAVSFNSSVGRPCRFAKPSGKPWRTAKSRRHCASVTARRENSARRASHTARPAECRTRRRNPHTTGKRRTTIPTHPDTVISRPHARTR